jgi:hypothetical protein
MPYEGEFAGYAPLRRITETESVQQLLRRARVYKSAQVGDGIVPKQAPPIPADLPDLVVAIDGSKAEVEVRNGYPGAEVGYVTVASVLLNLKEIDRLDQQRPADPREFRKTEEAASIDAALPGSNVVTGIHNHARDSFREALFDVLHDRIVDEQDRTRLLDTFEALLALKPKNRDGQRCPYDYRGCEERLDITAGVKNCQCSQQRPVFPTDALRIHEGFRDVGTNGEAFGEVMQVWERVLLVHLLRCFERRNWLARTKRLVFFLDGPLAVFGHPAWLSAAISAELKRLNEKARATTGDDLMILGIEKTGEFVEHFEQIDRTDTPGEQRFPPGTYIMPTDGYIKERIIFSDSPKRYGLDTYFGRKFLYKSRRGARIVASLPFLTDAQDTLDSDDIALYPRFATACALVDKLASSRFENALTPLVSAHAQAAIPLHLGAKVLEQLARALMRDEGL